MQTDRFIPVFWSSTTKALEAISNSGRRLVSVEDVGTVMPWESDVKGNPVICVGGEHDGIPEQVISASDQVIRLPMSGFVPSYNLQTAMGVVAIEAMKQNNLGK
jgi:tRNA G18 (ribose-2'-O)-methylase SpoU